MATFFPAPYKLSLDTTPQLSGNLDVNQQSVISTNNANITLAPHGTGKVTVSSADMDVGGELVADRLSWGSALGLWGVPHFEVCEFNDALWKADARYAPDVANSLSEDSIWTATPLDSSGDPHGSHSATNYTLPARLFDGDFDTYFELQASDPDVGDAGYTGGQNTKNELVIDFVGRTNNGAGTASGFVYPEGAVYLTFYTHNMYYDGTPTLEYYIGNTWTTLAAPVDVSRVSTYKTLKWEISSTNWLKKLRFTILAKPLVLAQADRTSGWDSTKRVGISSMNYYMDRFFTDDVEPPYLSKYVKRNSLYSQVTLEDGSADDASIGFRSSLSSTTTRNDHGVGKVQAGLYYNTTDSALVLTGGGVAALAVTSSQKVGIGTTTPTKELSVNGSIFLAADNQVIGRDDGTTRYGNWQFSNTSTQYRWGGDDQLIILSNGNVGIGALSPATELHLDGSLTLQAQASTPSNPAAGASVMWMDTGGDIKVKLNVGGTVKTVTLIDYSSS